MQRVESNVPNLLTVNRQCKVAFSTWWFSLTLTRSLLYCPLWNTWSLKESLVYVYTAFIVTQNKKLEGQGMEFFAGPMDPYS